MIIVCAAIGICIVIACLLIKNEANNKKQLDAEMREVQENMAKLNGVLAKAETESNARRWQ